MNNLEIGDIVFVKEYRYKSGQIGHNHLFVIISEEEAIEISYFGFLISSNIDKAKYPYNEKINKNEENKLQRDSVVKCDDLIKVSTKQIHFKIGRVTDEELKRFLNTYEKYLETI
jgi:mRNA-degrading endonuclease toxin of MazEF toxin-antitoxin module